MKKHSVYIQEVMGGNYFLCVEDKHGTILYIYGTKREVKARYRAYLKDLYTGVAKWPEKAVEDAMKAITEIK